MAGITDSPFRLLARTFGAGLLYTECISAEGLRRHAAKSLDLCRFLPEERPIAIQLFGSEPQQFADAAAIVSELFHPDLIDINCGCPVKKFVTRNCGGWLMQHPDRIGRIVEAVGLSSGLPVSVKLRRGYLPGNDTAVQAAVAAEEAGAVLIAVHARYVRRAKGTPATWDIIGAVKSAVRRIPVIGNGDVNSLWSAREMMRQTGCDRVMIARWACGRPWIFSPLSCGQVESDGIIYPSHWERISLLTGLYRRMLSHYPPKTALFRMRKHIGWFTAGMPHAAKLRGSVLTMSDPVEVLDQLYRFQAGLSREPVPAINDLEVGILANMEDD